MIQKRKDRFFETIVEEIEEVCVSLIYDNLHHPIKQPPSYKRTYTPAKSYKIAGKKSHKDCKDTLFPTQRRLK